LAAFEGHKTELTTTPNIRLPDWNLPFEVIFDAFDYTIGVVLGQRVDKLSHVICYTIMTLNDALTELLHH